MEKVIEESFAENYRVKICVRVLVFIMAAVVLMCVNYSPNLNLSGFIEIIINTMIMFFLGEVLLNGMRVFEQITDFIIHEAAVACFAVTMCGWSVYYGFGIIGLSFVFASCIGNRFGFSKSSKKVIVKNEQKDNWTGYDENFAKVMYVFLTIFIFVIWFNFKR
jgi:hypothetical protein